MSEETEYKGYIIKIEPDDDLPSPREDDNLGAMVCWHSRYDLGDKHDFCNTDVFMLGEEYLEDTPEDFELYTEHVPVIVLPLYLYDHGGITISTGREYPFNDRWDAGQVGYIYVTLEKVRKEYGWKLITHARRKKIEEYLRNEVHAYAQYLTGDIYGYNILDKDSESLDSCWGFYGEKECLEEAKSIVDHTIQKVHEELLEALLNPYDAAPTFA